MGWNVKTATDIMRCQLVTLRPDTTVLDATTRLLKDNISGAPVVDDEGIYQGVFSEKCCLNALAVPAQWAGEVGLPLPCVREFMTTSLITLSPDVNVFDAIDYILARRISGAPVLDKQGNFLGIFSEKTAMQVLISAAYDQLPGTTIDAYMNTDPRRVISGDQTLLEIANKFQETPFRRLPVLESEKLAGQVSRRDVIKAENQLVQRIVSELKKMGADDRVEQADCSAPIEKFTDREAKTISSGDDILSIAHIFLSTPYRRLPVVEANRLVGQVSRRDLLASTAALLRPQAERHKAEILYLSPLTDSTPPSLY